jgi:TatD DNase family protein
MIDTHCHLTDKAYKNDLEKVIERSRGANVTPLVIAVDSFEEANKALKLSKEHEDIFCMAGLHPHHASLWKDEDENRLKTYIDDFNVVAVGEIGLDYHYDRSPRDIQRSVFEKQLEIANDHDMPVVVHTREAISDTWDIVQRIKPKKLVVHCCTEKFEDVQKFLDQGYLLSFTGMATFPQARDIHETIKKTPIERIMIETDSPYLSPAPYRGKRNEPSYVIEVAKYIAELKEISLGEVDKITTNNAISFFGI